MIKMQKFCNQINNAYKINAVSVVLRFKKKYIGILKKMEELYFINSFEILSKYFIKVNLRYFNSKPLFYLCVSKKFNFLNMKKILRHRYFDSFNCYLYSTNKGILTLNELLWLKEGGLEVIKIEFLTKNFI